MEQTHDDVGDQPHDTGCHDGEDIPGLSSRHRRRACCLVTLRHSSPYCGGRGQITVIGKFRARLEEKAQVISNYNYLIIYDMIIQSSFAC